MSFLRSKLKLEVRVQPWTKQCDHSRHHPPGPWSPSPPRPSTNLRRPWPRRWARLGGGAGHSCYPPAWSQCCCRRGLAAPSASAPRSRRWGVWQCHRRAEPQQHRGNIWNHEAQPFSESSVPATPTNRPSSSCIMLSTSEKVVLMQILLLEGFWSLKPSSKCRGFFPMAFKKKSSVCTKMLQSLQKPGLKMSRPLQPCAGKLTVPELEQLGGFCEVAT